VSEGCEGGARSGVHSEAGGVAITLAVWVTVIFSYGCHDEYDGGLGLVFKEMLNENVRGGWEK
jgi:hypothetical protein